LEKEFLKETAQYIEKGLFSTIIANKIEFVDEFVVFRFIKFKIIYLLLIIMNKIFRNLIKKENFNDKNHFTFKFIILK